MNRSERAALVRSERGAAAVEFALVAPVLGLLLLATLDAALFLRTYFRIDRVATELANVISQHPAGRMTAADVDRYLQGPGAIYFLGAQAIAGEAIIVTSAPGATIITLIEGRPAGEEPAHRVVWQCRRGAASVPSRFRDPDQINPLPGGFRIPPEQTVIVVEVAAEANLWWFSRLFLGWFGGHGERRDLLYSYAIMRTRVGRLLPMEGVQPCS